MKIAIGSRAILIDHEIYREGEAAEEFLAAADNIEWEDGFFKVKFPGRTELFFFVQEDRVDWSYGLEIEGQTRHVKSFMQNLEKLLKDRYHAKAR